LDPAVYEGAEDLEEGCLMGLSLSEVRDVSCPVCGASPGSACVRIDARNGGGKKRARVHQNRVQAAGRKRSPERRTECRPMRAVLVEAMEAVLEGHPEKPIKLATNPVGDLLVRAMYLVDAFAGEMSASVAPAEQAQRAPDESGPIRFRYGVVSVPVF
jgi:hypothetical protein